MSPWSQLVNESEPSINLSGSLTNSFSSCEKNAEALKLVRSLTGQGWLMLEVGGKRQDSNCQFFKLQEICDWKIPGGAAGSNPARQSSGSLVGCPVASCRGLALAVLALVWSSRLFGRVYYDGLGMFSLEEIRRNIIAHLSAERAATKNWKLLMEFWTITTSTPCPENSYLR